MCMYIYTHRQNHYLYACSHADAHALAHVQKHTRRCRCACMKTSRSLDQTAFEPDGARAMPAIEVVADLGALNRWACEYHIASEEG